MREKWRKECPRENELRKDNEKNVDKKEQSEKN